MKTTEWNFTEREAIYYMPYHELESIVAFIKNFENDEIPESIQDYMDAWQDFLAENL